MTDDRATSRAAHLLPEEKGAGAENPQAMAEAILADSDAREADPQAAPDTFIERRTSQQAAE